MQFSALFTAFLFFLFPFTVICPLWNSQWSPAPSILLYTLHEGTISELEGVINALFKGQALSKTLLNSQTTLASAEIQSQLCDNYQVIIVSNAIPLATPLLEYVAYEEGSCSNTFILLNITNRFDYEVADKPKYWQLMRDLSQKKNVFWVPNNTFEMEWLRLAGVQVPSERVFMCLPVGYHVRIPLNEWPATLTHRPMVTSTRSDFWTLGAAKHLVHHPEFIINSYTFDVHYGGVEALKAYFDWFFYLPYQFSTMKVFESLREGLVVVVPSEKMFLGILAELRAAKSHEYTLPQMEQCIYREHSCDWQKFFDVYSPANEELTIKVRDWKQLRDWLMAGKILGGINVEAHKLKVASRMKQHERAQLAQWKSLFAEMGKVKANK
jgi:hypothetical protein